MVVPERYIELMHQSIDGEIRGEQQFELNRFLATSQEGKELHERFVYLADMKSKLPPADPPADLRTSILEAIDPHKYNYGSKHSSWAGIKTMVAQVITPRMAFGVAAGILMGLAIGTMMVGGSVGTGGIDPTAMVGTLVLDAPAIEDDKIRVESFSGPDATGQLTVRTKGEVALIRLDFSESREVAVVLEFMPDQWTLKSFGPDAYITTTLASSPGIVRIQHRGEGGFLIALSSSNEMSSPVAIRIDCESPIYRNSLTFSETAK